MMKYTTGRTCSRGDFAIQNIPLRTELGRKLRQEIAEQERERIMAHVDFDFEGMELRMYVEMQRGDRS